MMNILISKGCNIYAKDKVSVTEDSLVLIFEVCRPIKKLLKLLIRKITLCWQKNLRIFLATERKV